MIAHRSPISGVAAHGGRLVATAGYDNQVVLWDAASRTALGRGCHDHLANQIAFSPDGSRLVSASSDYTARLWSVPDLKLLAVLADHDDDVEMAAFHPSAPLVATASRDHAVRLFDLSGGLQATLAGHAADVISLAWSSDGAALVSSSDDGTIKRWSLADAALLEDIDLGGVETDTVAIDGAGAIYAGNDEGAILVIRGGRRRRVAAHAAGVKRLVYEPRENLLVSLSYDRTMRIWSPGGAAADDPDGGLTPVASATLPAAVWARSCAFLNGGALVFATFGSSYAVYDVAANRWDLDGVGPTDGINAVAVHADQRLTIGDAGVLKIDGRPAGEVGSLCNFLTPFAGRIVTGGQMGAVMDARTGAVLHQHSSPLNCATAFTRAGVSHLIVGAYTGEGLVFAAGEGGALRLVATLACHANAVKSVAASADRLFTVSADAGAAWFAIEDLGECARIERAHDRIANGCTALPDGRFASVSRDRVLRLWRGADVEAIPTPHDHSVKCVAASADGRWVACGAYDGKVALYDAGRRRWAAIRRPTTAGISSLCYDAGLKRFLAASYDGLVFEIPTAM
ncbi:MAG: hypothetical protein RIB45_04730 [Marivibrio sp.]|uniref:WD40 repeat domain-containing protein n=1 Tax=Marivibrio sp. TaxID=2039719 RepID=UPI0032EFD09C